VSTPAGVVTLVGAGPGEPGLITVRGLGALRDAEVVIYDRLVDRALLGEAPQAAERIDVGKKPGDAPVSQAQINEMIVDRAKRGLRVVRLKGGDPFIFGRGFEELSACREAGVLCIAIPGVSSAVAAPELAGIPLTLRNVSRSFAVLTAETAPDTTGVDFSRVRGVDTLVILMGRSRLAEVASLLIEAGWNGGTPVACIQQASTTQQKTVSGTLANIARRADEAELSAPMVTVVGDVAAQASSSPCQREGRGEDQTAVFEVQTSRKSIESSLAGKRILITRPRAAARRLASKLERLGAVPIVCPLLRIVLPSKNDELDASIARLGEYNWMAFTSAHAVAAFWRRLAACGFDARRIAGCKLAALGFATAARLRRHGIQPDATAHSAASLVSEIVARSGGTPGRVLWPRGDLALATLQDRLSEAGAMVDAPVAYRTQPIEPDERVRQEIQRGVDAVLLYSPSAAVQLASVAMPLDRTNVLCIGETTARVAERRMHVDAVAGEASDDGILAELVQLFSGKVSV